MVASVHVLHASPPEIGGFLRIGHTGHRKLEALLAANRLYFRRFVFDAAHIAEQTELVKSLRGSSGGKGVALDFQIIATNTLLRDAASRELLISSVRHLPIQNVWIRASGFGATATGAATRSFMESARHFHELQRPLVADYTGGLSGLAAAAFGVVGGMSHGVGQKETFRASGLNTPPKPGERKGSTKWIYVPELDRSFKQEQLGSLFGVRGARSRFGCNDSNCCPNGPEDMIENPHIHFITQRSRQLADLSNVPELRRAEHLLLRHLDPAVRAARLASRLHPDDQALVKAMLASKKRLVNLRDALGDLHATDSSATRSSMPTFRGNLKNLSSAASSQKK